MVVILDICTLHPRDYRHWGKDRKWYNRTFKVQYPLFVTESVTHYQSPIANPKKDAAESLGWRIYR
ncbi:MULTISPECIES: hypothetical protein [Aphanizomenon]|jgi:hypothetical protein|uniref:hypothetical protein n=1 Tax=Aphanizomenon TaxID=1175 RepID=UPI00057CD08A|nr:MULTISPECIES: hypothetical protein [Aphanizomenon]MTJ30283.1 hypothetical protein [Aphanizomenon sp. UHCC 0183]QSV69546.1 MAG: hypothetical protein HEQ20_00815 [Aphanizomenon flos-aquae KM1D3_PB]